MSFTKKMKIRYYSAFALLIIGIALWIYFSYSKNDMASSFGTAFIIIAAARIMQYIRLCKRPEAMQKREIAEEDERNILIWTKARSLTLSSYAVIISILSVVLYVTNHSQTAKILSYSLLLLLALYYICYFVIRKKN